ncbi:hypothetical protein [Oceanibaculum pacificum]|uniref:Uncharacterized protein n=1 Tax=Oceanibaculum pacificum TaxID=580166 RepID=A0A154W864_9PROT|nr:hypothetical protein [Oceanibaculum pacificum]KZD09729.1 hypothetical protein AUP43_06675 [Oceanibaculum pacificum]
MSVTGHHFPTPSVTLPRLGAVLRRVGYGLGAVLGAGTILLAIIAIRLLSAADTMPGVARAIFG